MLTIRPRRNRKSAAIRALVQETRLSPSDLIQPFFVSEGYAKRQPIESMPGIHRLTIDELLKECETCIKWGVRAVALFPVVQQEKKDAFGSEGLNEQGIIPVAIRHLKKSFPSLCLISDIALDPFTTHGHDGILDESGEVSNDETVEILAKMAVTHARAGVDWVAPSDMMDGRVSRIRKVLDQAGYSQVSIHSYAAKYASSLYAPFRDALSSKPARGDKKSYQLNPANRREALLESLLDENEGADILMVKPALPYLDVIALLKERSQLPISAYQVSGEYSMIQAAAERGWVDRDALLFETLLCIKRAGADMIFTYVAQEIAQKIIHGALD